MISEFPSSQETSERFWRAGWFATEATVMTPEGFRWVVTGQLGPRTVQAEAATQDEAWWKAWQQVEAALSHPPAPTLSSPAVLPEQARPGGSPEELVRFEGAQHWVECVAFTPDGRQIITGSGQPLQSGMSHPDFTVRLWDLSSGREVRRFEGHTHVVTSVAVSPDGQRILSGSYDQSMRLWDLATGQERHCFRGHTERIRTVALSPDGRLALSGSYDQTVRLWDLASGQERHCFRGHGNRILSVAFAREGRWVVSGSFDQTVRLWDLEAATGGGGSRWFRPFRSVAGRRESYRLLGHTQPVTSVTFSPDGRRLLTGSMDKTIRLWDVASKQEVRRFQGQAGGVLSVAFSPDGRRALSGGLDQRVHLWDVDTGRELYCYEGHTDVVTSVAFSPNGGQALTGSADKTVRLWQVPEAEKEFNHG